MMTNEKWNVKFIEEIPDDLNSLEEKTFYVVDKHKIVIHYCPCGCGHVIVLPISKTKWTMTNNEAGITLNPSVLNKPCNAHYFVRDSKIVWC